MKSVPKNLFITGTPGVGKTTLIKEVTLSYRDKVSGFYTEELREGSARRGFRVKSFKTPERPSREGLFAAKGLKSAAKFGKYGVDIKVLEEIGVASLREALKVPGRLLIIDEIGPMEALSEDFHNVLLECLLSPAHPVLATIRKNAQPFTDHVKTLENTAMMTLSRANYGEVKEEIRRWLHAIFN